MGCGDSKPKVSEQPSLTHALTRQMTVGEAQDHKLPHNLTITEQLEAARQEIRAGVGKWIWDEYTDETRLLGRGAFARVFLGRQKATGKLVAIKVIAKDNKFYEQQVRAMVNKVACMRTLQGHRSMVQLYGVYHEPEGDHVVLEFMPARPLFDAIVEKGHFSEADAAVVIKQLLEFMVFMHGKNVVHRDIKPENLLLIKPRRATFLKQGGVPPNDGAESEDDEEAKANKLPWLTPEEEKLIDERVWADVPDGLRLKVIDYGTCNFCEAGQHLHSKIGTARYIAPEVLARDYDKSSDIWSAGVVLYILLCGLTPFKGSTDTGTLAKVKAGVYSLEGPEWAHVSASAKDLVRHMMDVDPSRRWTAEELLEHPWFLEAPEMVEGPGAAARNSYLERLTGFAGMSRMKRLMLKLLASEEDTMTTTEVARLKKLFADLDTDGDGLIDGGALHRGLAAVGCNLSLGDVREFLAVSDVDTGRTAGMIDINEFIAALFDSQKVVKHKPEMIEAEFRRLDADGDGIITPSDLVAASAAGGGAGALLGRAVAPLSLEEAQGILEELAAQREEAEGGKATTSDLTRSAQELALGLSFNDFRALLSSPTSALATAALTGDFKVLPRVASAQALADADKGDKDKGSVAVGESAPQSLFAPRTPPSERDMPASLSDMSRTGEPQPLTNGNGKAA